VLPADILGQVYEQFLGKVIRLTKGHQAKVEYKPEVKKAGGVYYTPTSVVEYIVARTVGRQLEGKTPRQAAKLRILDPACGSGSFLIAAYQYLLDWHRDWYVKDGPEKYRDELYQGPGGAWHLSTGERKRIVTTSIYGVDLDPQAVEVTKLSLLLKVLEGESQETIQKSLRLFRERALPDLGSNIKCGNSLIGPDFYEDRQMSLLEEHDAQRVNPFDWRAEFPDVFARRKGSFNAVIGNSPYLFLTEVSEKLRRYYEARYRSVSYRFDLYGAFIERALLVQLAPGGLLGFIIPHTLLSNDSFQRLRALVAETACVSEVVDLGPGIFKQARNETMLLFLARGAAPDDASVHVVRTTAALFPRSLEEFEARQGDWISREGDPWLVRVTREHAAILKKLHAARFRLGQLCTINQGLRTGDNPRYLAEKPRGASWKPAACAGPS
jgi:type I restriction-modification system DNA methylase subunit